MSPMFVPVVDEETPRSEREKKKKGEKENAHSRFHRTHDKSGETFGSSDVDFREEEQDGTFLGRTRRRRCRKKRGKDNGWGIFSDGTRRTCSGITSTVNDTKKTMTFGAKRG